MESATIKSDKELQLIELVCHLLCIRTVVIFVDTPSKENKIFLWMTFIILYFKSYILSGVGFRIMSKQEGRMWKGNISGHWI